MRTLRQRVSVKIGLAVAAVVLLVAFGQWLVFRGTLEVYGQEIRRRLVDPGIALAIANVRANGTDARRLRDELGGVEDFCVAVYDVDGVLLAQSRDDVPGTLASLSADVRRLARSTPDRAQSIGAARLDAPTEVVVALSGGGRAAYLGLFERGAAVTLFAVRMRALTATMVLLAVLALGVTVLIARRIRRGILRAHGVVQRIADGSLGERLPAAGDDEIGVLVSDFNRMADRTEELVATLRREEERKRRLFAAFTHELNTPLTSVLGYLESLKMPDVDADPETRRRYVEIAFDQAKALEALAEDLETLSRLDREGLPLDRAPHELGALARREVEALEKRAVAADVRIEVLGEPVLVDVDRRRLGQVVRNLLDNAIRHSTGGGTVRVLVRREGGEPVIEVRDEGEGIAPEHLPSLGEPMWRADPSRTRGTGGRGLGLAIARGIVEAHGGRMTIASEVGKGTSVRIDLPRHPE